MCYDSFYIINYEIFQYAELQSKLKDYEMANISFNSMIGNLNQAIYDVHYTVHGGLFKKDYQQLLIELRLLQGKDVLLPRTYQANVLEPFIKFLETLGKDQFDKIFNEDEEKISVQERNQKKIIEEVAEALLQRNHQHKYYLSSFKDLQAFQAVVTTIYDDIRNSKVHQLVQNTIAPLAKWGNRKGPYTFPKEKTSKVNVQVGIVNLPPEYRNGGLLAWSSIGHEVAGHNILHSHPELISQLKEAIREAIRNKCTAAKEKDVLANYWCACTDEIASDVLGILNTGPSFGIGFVGYIRGKRGGKLQSSGPLHSSEITPRKSLQLFSEDDKSVNIFVDRLSDNITVEKEAGTFGFLEPKEKKPLKYEKIFFPVGRHPLDILRPFAMTKIIELLDYSSPWKLLIEDEVVKDFENSNEITFKSLKTSSGVPCIEQLKIPRGLAIETAKITAEAIAKTPLTCLNSRCLMDAVTWTEEDEILVSEIGKAIKDEHVKHLPPLPIKGRFYARHIVAASILESVNKNSDIEMIFNKMKLYLVEAYGKISIWNSEVKESGEPFTKSTGWVQEITRPANLLNPRNGHSRVNCPLPQNPRFLKGLVVLPEAL